MNNTQKNNEVTAPLDIERGLLEAEEATTYCIRRFYRDIGEAAQVMRTGLTLEQAQAHCKDPSTAGDGWFDGFARE